MLAILKMQAYIASVNSRQTRTLKAVFTDPVSGTIAWADIESLLKAAGCEVVEGNGSCSVPAQTGPSEVLIPRLSPFGWCVSFGGPLLQS